MSDVQRLEAELALAKACEVLEDAREALHADRTPETVTAYREACDAVVALRRSFREKYRVEAGPGDAAPEVETVRVKAGVSE